MCSRGSGPRRASRTATLALPLAGLLAAAAAPAGAPLDSAPTSAPTSAATSAPPRPRVAPLRQNEVLTAIEALRKDPNFGRERTIKTLRWVKSDDERVELPNAPNWLVGLFQFLSESARVLLWVCGGVLVAFVAVWAYRFVRGRRADRDPEAAAAISHVQDLDIRPASLPADIGEAALALLAQGRARDALSLLYRGALSRAVHRFAVVIRESYTEGEVLRAVRRTMDPRHTQYFASLVSLWQRAVYAADVLPDEDIASLCRQFSPTLGAAAI